MFLLAMFLMDGPVPSNKPASVGEGQDNVNYVNDEGKTSTLELPRLPPRLSLNHDSSRY